MGTHRGAINRPIQTGTNTAHEYGLGEGMIFSARTRSVKRLDFLPTEPPVEVDIA